MAALPGGGVRGAGSGHEARARVSFPLAAVLLWMTMRRDRWKLLIWGVALGAATLGLTKLSSAADDRRILAQPLVMRLESLKWSPLFPELGRRASIAILRIDPRTHASQVVVRFLGPVHIP